MPPGSWTIDTADPLQVLNLVLLLLFGVLLVVGARRLPIAYTLFALPQFVLLATRIQPTPLTSTNRYLLVIFPVFVVLALIPWPRVRLGWAITSIAVPGAAPRGVPAGRLRGVALSGMTERTILHVDLDAFFAAVEQRDRPELRGKPVIVGGDPGGRGVVSAASYEARRFGVRSAMSLPEAARRCPDGVFLPVDGRRYQQASREVMSILRRFTPLVEPISIDEAFLDVTGSRPCSATGETIAGRDQGGVRDEVGLTASVGVATTKLVAKIASDLRKPDGLVVVAAGRRGGVPRAAADRAAVGRRREDGDRARRVRRPDHRRPRRAAARRPRPAIRQARRVARRAGARHRRRPGPRWRSGQVGRATRRRSTSTPSDPEVIERTLLALAEGVAGRLRSAGVRASTIAVKVRDSSFRTITRQRTLPEPTDLTEPIYRVALELARPEVRGIRVRLLGVTASNLGEREQLGLFADEDPRRRAAIEAADATPAPVRRPAPSPAAGWSGAGLPAPFERDPRNPLDRRARGVPVEPDDRGPTAARRP